MPTPTPMHNSRRFLDGPRNTEWYGARMATLGAATVGEFIRRQLTFDLGDCVGAISCRR